MPPVINRRWTWDTESSEWGVNLEESGRVLQWWGADKYRPGVPAYAMAGGGVDQRVDEFLATRRSPYSCPDAILQDVLAACLALPPAPVVPPNLEFAIPREPTETEVVSALRAAFTAVVELTLDARHEVLEQIQHDPPTGGVDAVTTLRLGGMFIITHTRGHPPGSRWTTDNFAARGALEMVVQDHRCALTGDPRAVEALASALKSVLGIPG